MTTQNHPETRLIDRRCRCGKLLAHPHPPCHWHAHGSAQYADDLLTYIAIHDVPKWDRWRRLLRLVKKPKEGDDTVNLYMFEYQKDGRDQKPVPVRAANVADAFDAFRAEHPSVPITYVWVELFGAE
jgi:hypothetical protein